MEIVKYDEHGKILSKLAVTKGMYESQYKVIGYVPFDVKNIVDEVKITVDENETNTPVNDETDENEVENEQEYEENEENEEQEQNAEYISDEDLIVIPTSEMTNEQLKRFAKLMNVKIKGMKREDIVKLLASKQ